MIHRLTSYEKLVKGGEFCICRRFIRYYKGYTKLKSI